MLFWIFHRGAKFFNFACCFVKALMTVASSNGLFRFQNRNRWSYCYVPCNAFCIFFLWDPSRLTQYMKEVSDQYVANKEKIRYSIYVIAQWELPKTLNNFLLISAITGVCNCYENESGFHFKSFRQGCKHSSDNRVKFHFSRVHVHRQCMGTHPVDVVVT